MNRLSTQERSHILQLLCKGMAIWAVARTTGVSRNTIVRLLMKAGAVCQAYHDEHVGNLSSKHIQCDEIWSFCNPNAKNVASAKAAPAGGTDVWTWAAIDADSKLVVSWLIGRRDAEYANTFMQDVASRLSNRVQLTTNGPKSYLEAVEGAFGLDADYAQLVKLYGPSPDGARRYSPVQRIGFQQTKVRGTPDKAHISTSYVERRNLTMQICMRRFARLTASFSNKVENHVHALALHFMYYNFVRIHKALRVTPAMAAGVTGRLWDMPDIVALLESREAVQDRSRGPYKRNRGQPDV